MPRPPKVSGIRTTQVDASEESALPDKKEGIFQFRSRAAALRLSLRRRRVLRGPDGEAVEDVPRANDGTEAPLDQVIFDGNYYETRSPEVAELIRKAQGFGVGLEVWELKDEKAALDEAFERELRERIAMRPDIARKVLTPGDGADFVLPPPAA